LGLCLGASTLHVWLCVGYDGIPEFVPALLDLIRSKLAGTEGTGSDNKLVKLEQASAFYLPPICGLVTDNHDAEPAVRADDCLKLSTAGCQFSTALCGGDSNVSYVEPVITLSTAGKGFKSHHTDVTNGTV